MVLDTIWESPTAREKFYEMRADLATLGPLIHEVFAPAYKAFKERQDVATLAALTREVTDEMLEPYLKRATFKEVWENWGDQTRELFVREKLEVRLAVMMMKSYGEELFEAYRVAYAHYLENNPAANP